MFSCWSAKYRRVYHSFCGEWRHRSNLWMQNFETTKAIRCVCVPWHVEIKHCFPFCIFVNDNMAYGRNQAMRSIRLPYKLSHSPVFIHPSIICATFRTKNKYNSCNCNIQGSKYTTNRPVWLFYFSPHCATYNVILGSMRWTPLLQSIQDIRTP